MNALELLAVATTLLVSGLVGSLHCIAMCGPLLLAFEGGAPRATLRASLRQTAYHGGRIWTYALLGFAAALLRRDAVRIAPSGGLARVLLLFAGVALLVAAFRLIRSGDPGTSRWFERPIGACTATLTRWPVTRSLLASRSVASRFLLGTAMGLLPCGLVYAALLIAATLPPLAAAAAMAAFGIGTVPALAGSVLGYRLLPERWRRQPPRVATWLLFLASAIVIVRALSALS